MHPAIASKLDALRAVCAAHGVARLDLFGSALDAAAFAPGRSDADLLVEFQPGRDPGTAGFLDLKEALEGALGLPVDLVERPAVEASRNPIRRRLILSEAVPVFGA